MTIELQPNLEHRLGASQAAIEAFCQRWNIVEFALFGSVLRDDFRADSDIDVLVTFSATARCGLDEMIQMKDEIEDLFGRKVDFIIRSSIERSPNRRRRRRILDSAETIYAI